MQVEKKAYYVNVQMILAIILIVDLWAAYRIEKLRLGFVLDWDACNFRYASDY